MTLKFKISEIFASLQGEGRYAGRPANFIRFGTCNLRCPLCDEKDKLNVYSELPTEEIVKRLRKDIKYVILTGGEPLIQPDIDKLIDVLSIGFRVLIETNGTRFIDRFFYAFVSPKPGVPVDKRWFSTSDVDFKFVVTTDPDPQAPAWNIYDAIEFIERNKLRRSRVFLMPVTRNGKMDKEECGKIWDFCLDYGLNYSDRLQIRCGRR